MIFFEISAWDNLVEIWKTFGNFDLSGPFPNVMPDRNRNYGARTLCAVNCYRHSFVRATDLLRTVLTF
jgi:hypothetical protein